MRIGLIGHGVVGSGVSRIIDAGETPTTTTMQIVSILTRTPRDTNDPRFTTNAEAFFATNPDVIVECAGGIDGPFPLVMRALKAGIPVVTANKKLVATHYPELLQAALSTDSRLLFEASTGGGIPWLRNLQLLRHCDRITTFRGIFNGTTNYILDNMTKQGSDFAATLTQAQEKGYAEADPTDDVDGYDVRYKCALSADIAWKAHLDPAQIPRWGIATVSAADIAWGQRHGYTLKMVGYAHLLPQAVLDKNGASAPAQVEAAVLPNFVPPQDLLSTIDDNNNCGIVDSSNLGRSAYAGQGAGSLPTAFSIIQDLADLSHNGYTNSGLPDTLRHLDGTLSHLQVNNDTATHRFYLRANALHPDALSGYNLTVCDGHDDLPAGAIICEATTSAVAAATSALNLPDLFVAKIN